MTATWRSVILVALVVLGVLCLGLGALMFLAAGLAMGPEDEVPALEVLIPLALGTVLFSAGIVIARRRV